MTFVGKILVIVIMAFSLMFLGISTVVFTTATNWKAATTAAKTKVAELQKKNSDATTAIKSLEGDLAKAKNEHTGAVQRLETPSNSSLRTSIRFAARPPRPIPTWPRRRRTPRPH